MRFVSVVEGCTLLILVFVADPIKHLGGYAIATTIMGPIHGMAFLLYIWTLIQTVSRTDFRRPDVVQMVMAAFIPFGAFLNERALSARPCSPRPEWGRHALRLSLAQGLPHRCGHDLDQVAWWLPVSRSPAAGCAQEFRLRRTHSISIRFAAGIEASRFRQCS